MSKGIINTFPLLFIFIISAFLVWVSVTNYKTNVKPIKDEKSMQENNEVASFFSLVKTINSENEKDVIFADDSAQTDLLGATTTPSYSVITLPLAGSTVVTDSANDDDCGNDCPAKPLKQYVAENGGKAGMNGTYFCPPDYGWCSGKKNTYDFPIWNNRKKKWMRADTLFWGGRGMMVFRPGSAQFFPNAAGVGAPSDITGGVVNYPPLVSGAKIAFDPNSLPDNLKTTKGTRGGIGFGNGKLFLVVARRANMSDLAGIFISLGASDALNLDGGGSAALYQNGRYKAGPGRALPNAIIVK